MGIIKEPKLVTKPATAPVPAKAKYRCDSCGVDASIVSMEAAQVESLQVIRCVDPVSCRMRAQKTGTWCLV